MGQGPWGEGCQGTGVEEPEPQEAAKAYIGSQAGWGSVEDEGRATEVGKVQTGGPVEEDGLEGVHIDGGKDTVEIEGAEGAQGGAQYGRIGS